MGTRSTQTDEVQSEKAEWESVGRRLAHAQLEEHAEETRLALVEVGNAAREGEITANDLRRCYAALTDAELLLDEIADAVDGFERPPRLEEELSQDQIVEALGD